MRILHVTPYFEGSWAYGGIPRVASVTVRALVARGHHVTVCTTDACRADARLPAGERSVRELDMAEIVVFRNVSNSVAYHLQFFMPIGMRTYLKRHAGTFDVAHIHGCHHVPGSIAARYLRQAAVPYVLTPHGTAPYLERRKTAKRVFDATIGRGVLEGASRIVAVSRAEQRQLIDFGIPAGQLSVIPNPLDITEFSGIVRGQFRERFGIASDEPVVTYLGKLTAQKRLDTLVKAFAALRHPTARLVIAGNDMGYGAQLRQLIDRYGVADRTLLTGLLPGQARLLALADADVVPYASEGEVFGLVAIEALLCGTPVIVADDHGCGEIVRETGGGLLVPPGDAASLRNALEQMIADRETWRQRALSARQGAMRYSSEAVAAALERMYPLAAAGAARPFATAV